MGRRWGLEFDEPAIRRLIRSMTPRSRFFQVLREELKSVGRWKNLPRGQHAVRSELGNDKALAKPRCPFTIQRPIHLAHAASTATC